MIKKVSLKTLLGVLIFIVMSSYSFPAIVFNWSECVFEGECEESSASSMGLLVIEGASYFLDASANVYDFLARVEMADINGIDNNKLRETLYKTIEGLEKSREAYQTLKLKADSTPYNRAVIKRLKRFNYNRFRKEVGPNRNIFDEVKELLKKGDVRGIYAKILVDIEEILEKLYSVKEFVDADRFPEIPTLWRINEAFAELRLFGQYTSHVLQHIMRK